MSPTISNKKQKASKIRTLLSALKSIVFVLCVAGFSYQVSEFLTRYYTHPTVVNIDVNESLNFVEPALTFCNLNPIRRKKYCYSQPENCEEPENIQQFCMEKPHYCRQKNTSHLLIPKPFKYLKPALKDLAEFGQNETDYFIASYWLSTYTGTERFEQTWQHHSDSDIVPCFSLNNRENSNQEPKIGHFLPRIYGVASRQIFTLNVEEDEMFDPRKIPRAILSIHSPFAVSDVELKAVILEPGKAYKIHIELAEHHFLTAPYRTDCLDYVALWEKNNKTGPREQRDCMLRCYDKIVRFCLNCTQNIHAKLEEKCTGDYRELITCLERLTESEKKKFVRCYDQCKKECIKRIYFIRVEQSAAFLEKLTDEYQRRLIEVDLLIGDPEVLIYQHKPQYMDVELFSTIGGFLGCWLGISTYSSVDFLLTLPRIILARFKKFLTKFKILHGDI